MKIEKINIKKLKSPSYNPRDISPAEMEKLKISIQEFGYVDPIIVNDVNMHIIGGNQRYQAMLELGYDEVEVSYVHIEDMNREKALNIRLNNSSGQWNEEKLVNILEELELDNFDISLTGFDDIEDLVIDLDSGDYTPAETEIEDEDDFLYDEESDSTSNADLTENIVEDEIEVDEDIEVTVKTGDLYQLGNHYLLCGDATKKEDINRLIADNKIDMILTDAPYGMGLDTDYSKMDGLKENFKQTHPKSEFSQRKNPPKANKYAEGKVDVFDERFIKNILDLNIAETFLWGADYFTECIPNLKEGSWIVWDKRSNEHTDLAGAVSSDKMFGSAFELCWSKTKHRREIARIKWAGLFGIETEFDKKRHHPTQKPVKLNAWFINKYGSAGFNILDLFGGSGSTLLACEQTDCNCFMMEIDTYYCQVIINRWEAFTGDKAVKL